MRPSLAAPMPLYVSWASAKPESYTRASSLGTVGVSLAA
jgi:hypothetical protein